MALPRTALGSVVAASRQAKATTSVNLVTIEDAEKRQSLRRAAHDMAAVVGRAPTCTPHDANGVARLSTIFRTRPLGIPKSLVRSLSAHPEEDTHQQEAAV
mmetsp:Transcript_48691/g.155608  ORF Transcript_48691/g.155608 Transcript_48691/m.155608 type:complete len:101 (+) Transcript_48691:51-353(+)